VTGDRFTRKELVDQIAVLFLAGHETSASALGWALYLIATHSGVQERMHQESDGVFGGRAAEFGDMKRLRLARDVFREALRLYPPVSFISRDTVQTERMRSKTLAKGSVVMVSPWLIQRHRRLWDRPDDFDPDRFATAAGKESARQAYLPFSAGPRVCLGASFAMQEATLILAQLMRDFHFDKVADHTPVPIARLTLRSENGIRLTVRKRLPGCAAAVPGNPDETGEPAAAGCPFH
jgi:cytochrome P450